MPGTVIKIWPTADSRDIIEIKIGVTGSYYVDLGIEIYKLEVPASVVKRYPNTSMTYSFYSIAQNSFDKISNVKVEEVPAIQFIGENDAIKEIEWVLYNGKWLRNPKVDILQFYLVNGQKRSVEKATYQNGKYYNLNGEELEVDPFTLYAIGKWINKDDEDWDKIYHDDPFNPSDYYRPGYPARRFLIQEYRDPFNNNIRIVPENYDPSIYVNGNQNSLKETIEVNMMRPGKLTSLEVGNGSMLIASYQIRTIDFSIEDDSLWGVKIYKDNYLNLKAELDNYLDGLNDESVPEDYEMEQELRKRVKQAYAQYINALIEEQKKEREAEGKL